MRDRPKYFFLILLCCALISHAEQDSPALETIKSKLDSALNFEDELKVKTAHQFFKSVKQPVEQLLQADSTNAELWKIHGIINSKIGTIGQAYEAFKRSVILDSANLENQIEYIDFTLNTARNLASDNQQFKSQQWLQNAFNVCAAALLIYPESSQLHELVGDIYASTNDIDNCTYHYQKAFNAKRKPELALKLYRLYAVNKDYDNEVRMAGILNQRYSTYAEFYAVQGQLSLDGIVSDSDEQSRYLPGVKRTVLMAIDLGSKNPNTYQNYFEIIKLGFAFDPAYEADKNEINKVMNKASEVFSQVDLAKAGILLSGAELLKDLGYKTEACEAYSSAMALNTRKTGSGKTMFCD